MNKTFKLICIFYISLSCFFNFNSFIAYAQNIKNLSNSYPNIILRAETKEKEARTPLTPKDVRTLIAKGLNIWVESSKQRIFKDEEYSKAGATLVPAQTYLNKAKINSSTIILGLKELPDNISHYSGNHMYFSHSFKGQEGSEDLLKKFDKDHGTIIDLEFLLDAKGKRLVAFGFWAGEAGVCLGLIRWCHKQLGISTQETNVFIKNLKEKINESQESYMIIKKLLSEVKIKKGSVPKVMVIGASGRSGQGTIHFLNEVGIPSKNIIKLGRKDTKTMNPNNMLVGADILVNCVSTKNEEKSNPFVSQDMIEIAKTVKLQILVDVTCDYVSHLHKFPFYRTGSSFENAFNNYSFKNKFSPSRYDIEVVAIDHLPSFFPKESSEEFSDGLTKILSNFILSKDKNQSDPIQKAINLFHKIKRKISYSI